MPGFFIPYRCILILPKPGVIVACAFQNKPFLGNIV